MKNTEDIISMNELCEWLNISRNTALELIRGDKITAYKTGKRRWSIVRSSVEKFMENAINESKNSNSEKEKLK